MRPPADHNSAWPLDQFWWGLCLSGLMIPAMTSSGDAALYACREPSGVTVITDSPAQLSGCTLLSRTPSSPAPPQRDPAPAPPSHRSPESEAPSPALPQATALTIPLERLGSLFVITVHVNGTRPTKMILDTGASHTLLSHAVARELSLWAQYRSASITMHTAGGPVQAEVLPIALLRIGEAEVRNIEVVIHDLPEAPPHIEGLLGLNALGHFTVTLDAVRNRLLLGGSP